MANTPAIKTFQVPAYFQEFIDKDRQKQAMAEAGIPFRRLSIYSKNWSIIDEAKERTFLTGEYQGSKVPIPFIDVVVVDASKFTSRVWFANREFDNEDTAPPACGSTDGIVPDARFGDERQNPQCYGCQWDAWGSGARGTGKSCKQGKVIAVIPWWEMQDGNKGTPLQFRIPTDSMKIWNTYLSTLGRSGAAYDLMVTRMRIDPEKEGGQVNFEPAMALERNTIITVKEWQLDPLVERILYVGAEIETDSTGQLRVKQPSETPLAPLPDGARTAKATASDKIAAARAAATTVAPNGHDAPVSAQTVVPTSADAPVASSKPRRVVAKTEPVAPPPPAPPTDEERLAAYDALVAKATAAHEKIAVAEDDDEREFRRGKYEKAKAEVEALEQVLVADGLLSEEDEEATEEPAPAVAASSSTVTSDDLLGKLDSVMGQVPTE